MFEFKPDYEKSKQRIDAFWECELIDRPVAQFSVPRPPEQQTVLPVSHHATPAERWLDAQWQAEFALARLSNIDFMADSMPVTYPSLGPEVFSALYGCPIHFGDYGTSWTDPILFDWAEAPKLQVQWDGFAMRKLIEMTDTLIEVGRGKFIVGMTDWHPGGDGVAAFRDPERLAVDMIDHRDDVVALLGRMEGDYFRVFDFFYNKLRAAGLPLSTWCPLVSDEKWYLPSNDFSCMVSKRMFDDVFLPGIVAECKFLAHSLYHLDGPNALQHLDSLLAIPELNAIQWVFGAGREGFMRWLPVYKKIQAAGKGIEVVCSYAEIDDVIENLDPHGVFLAVGGVPSREAGLDLERRLERWAVKHAHTR